MSIASCRMDRDQIRRPCRGLSSARLRVLNESSPLEGVEGREEPTDDDDDEASSSLSTESSFMSVASLIIMSGICCRPRLGQKRNRDHRTLPHRRER